MTHIKATGRSNWGLMRDAVAAINDARAQGVPITADQYPFLQGAPIDYITALIDVPADVQPLHDLANGLQDADFATTDQTNLRQRFVTELQYALRDDELRAIPSTSASLGTLNLTAAALRVGLVARF